METLEFTSLPQITFAHIFEAEHYAARLNPNSRLVEVAYIVEGELFVEAADHTYTAGKGDILCLFHRDNIRISAPGFHHHHTVGAYVDFVPNADAQAGLQLPLVLRAEEDTGELYAMIDSIIHSQSIYMESRTRGAALFLSILCQIDKCSRKVQQTRLPSEQLYTQRAKDYVHKNIYRPITQKEVAEYLGISSGYLCGVFKNTEGISLMKYINKTKLENLKLRMDDGNIKLYEAAALFGYRDPNYVSRLFKQFFGYNITDRHLPYRPKSQTPEE